MVFVALITDDPNLSHALSQELSADFKLHILSPDKSAADVCVGLQALKYAGGLIIDSNWQQQTFPYCMRSSLSASEVSATDTLIVTPAGIVGDYVLGQAISNLLKHHEWDIKGASIVITGSSAMARVLSKELASLGAGTINVVAENRPSAEQTLPKIATSKTVAHVFGDSTINSAFERADLIIRTESMSHIPNDILGPHLSVIDLSPSPLSTLRQEALRVGSPNFGLRDLQAHQLSIGLAAILGININVELFLNPLLSLAE